MRRRSSAGGEPAKVQRRKTVARKSRVTSKAADPKSSSAAREETKVARLTRERDEALAQLTATADVLRVINRSKFDLQAMLQGVLDTPLVYAALIVSHIDSKRRLSLCGRPWRESG